MPGPIDSLSVGIGVDLTHLEGQLRTAKRQVDSALPRERLIRVTVELKDAQVRQFAKDLNKGLTPGKGAITEPISVPIKPVFRREDFRKEILGLIGGFITVPVKGSWDGWVPGREPPEGAGGGGRGRGGGRGPTTGGGGAAAAGPASAPPAGTGPAPATGRAPRSTRARQTAAPVKEAYRPPPNYARGGGVEARSSDVYETQAPAAAPAGPRPVTQRGAGKTRTDTSQRPYVTTTNVRYGSAEQELEGEARAEFLRATRGRPTRPADLRPQPGETAGAIASTVRAPRGQAGVSLAGNLAEQQRAGERSRAAAARMADPSFQALRQQIRAGFHGFDPNLAAAFDRLADPDLGGGFEDFIEAANARAAARTTRLPEGRGASAEKQKQLLQTLRARAIGLKKGDVPDEFLAYDSAMRGLEEFSRGVLDPTYHVRTSDTKLRGPGGKVGRVGGRNAGRVPGMTVELSKQKRQPRLKPLEVAPIVPGQAYGFEGLDVPIPGGQGLFDRTKSARTSGRVDPALFPVGEGETGYGRPQVSPLTPGERMRSLYLRTRLGRRGINFPPFERLAEGGLLYAADARYLQGVFNIPGALRAEKIVSGAMPRPGSRARQEAEERLANRLRNRELRSRKPLYQQGGGSDPGHRARAAAQFERDPFCRYCGRRTERGGRGELAFTLEHIRDYSGSPELHEDPSNLGTACLSCNSYKSGGKSARPLFAGQRIRQIGMADGGTMRSGGLLNSQRATDVTMVGERGPELIVQDRNTGQAEVVPSHRVQSFLDHRQEGGDLRYGMRGQRGRFGAGNPILSRGTLSGGDIQRVFVVNWPGGGGGFGTTGAEGRPRWARAETPGPTVGEEGTAGRSPAGAPSPEARAPRRTTDPYLRVAAREAALRGEERPGSTAQRLLAVRAGISEAQQLTPVRAPSVALGQVFQTLFGGRADIQRRERAAALAAARAGRAQTQLTGLRAQDYERRFRIGQIERGEETFATPEERESTLAGLRAQGPGLLRARQAQRAALEQRTGRAEELQRNILTPVQALRSQAAGLVGVIGGTAVFSAAMAAFAAAAEVAAKQLEPGIDALSGWSGAIQRSTQAIAQNVVALHGQAAVAGAQQAAQIGLSAGYFQATGGPIMGRAQALAAGQVSQQQLDYTRATRGLGMNVPGYDRALFGGTGGLLGGNFATEIFGGQAGVLQNVVKRLTLPGRQTQVTGGSAIEHLLRGDLGLGGPGPESVDQRVIDDLNAKLKQTSSDFTLVSKASQPLIDAMVASAKATSDATGDQEVLNRANELAQRGIAVTRGGQGLTGTQFAQGGQAIGGALLALDPTLALQGTQNQRRARAQLAAIQGQNARQQDIPANFFLQAIANPLQTRGTQAAIRAIGAGSLTRAGAGPTEGIGDTLKNIDKNTSLSAAANTELTDRITRGEGAAVGIVGNILQPGGRPGRPVDVGGARRNQPNQAVAAFQGAVGQVAGIAGQIQAITEPLEIRQAQLSADQYVEQMRVANRQLSDAKDLWAGINGAVVNTVGGLQGQNMLLDRQNQLLSRRQQQLGFKSEDVGFRTSQLQRQLELLQFGQQQRQINFQIASAGFVAPGTTPQERAARQDEAEKEAQFAQKQLNLQEKIAAQGQIQVRIARQIALIGREITRNSNRQQDNAFRINKLQSQRDITDLSKQIDIAVRARKLEVDTEDVNKRVADLNKLMEEPLQTAQQLITQGQKARDDALADLADLSAQTGEDMHKLVKDVSQAWSDAATSYYSNFLLPTYNNIRQLSGQGYRGGGPTNADVSGGGGQSGLIADVHTQTSFTAGEVGHEKVVILRNPKSGMWSGGGGGGGGGGVNFYGGINITISGAADSSDKTADELARKVEERINKKLSMIAGNG